MRLSDSKREMYQFCIFFSVACTYMEKSKKSDTNMAGSLCCMRGLTCSTLIPSTMTMSGVSIHWSWLGMTSYSRWEYMGAETFSFPDLRSARNCMSRLIS